MIGKYKAKGSSRNVRIYAIVSKGKNYSSDAIISLKYHLVWISRMGMIAGSVDREVATVCL